MNTDQPDSNQTAVIEDERSGIRISIKVKLAIAFTVIIGLTILALSVIFLNKQKEQLYIQTIETGKISLNYFVSNASISLLNDNILELNKLIKETSSTEGLLYGIIIDREKIVKAHTDSNQIGKPFQPFGQTKDAVSDGTVTFYQYVTPAGSNILNLSRTVKLQDKVLGEVHVGISVDFIEKMIKKEALFILMVASFIILGGIVIAIIMGVGLAKPISKLVRATREIGNGNFQHRVNIKQNDELGDLASSFNYMAQELGLKEMMKSSFGKYVSPEIVKMIMENPEQTWLKGTRNEATVLFTDIRGFTSYSETREPEEIVESLNEYFEIATKAILDHGGHVDKFVGDAVLGLFGVPVKHEDHVERAVRACLAMQRDLKKAGENGKNILLPRIGIGVNSGVVVSGNLGSDIKMEYTVIGDTVNVASRLNGLAKDGETVVSKGIYEKLKNIITVEALPPQKIKGKTEPVETFKVLSIKDKK